MNGRQYVGKVLPEQIYVGSLFRNSNVNTAYGFSAPIMFISSTTCRPSCSGPCFWLLRASMASLHPLCLSTVPPVSCPAPGRVSGCYRRLWLLCTHYVYPQYHLSPVLLGVVFLAATGVYGFSAPIMFIHSTTCLPSCSGSCFWLLRASMASLHPLCLSTVPPVSRPARGRVSGCYRRLWLLCTHYVYPQYHLSPVLLGVVFLAATGVYGFSAPIMFIHSTTCLPSCSGSCFWLLPASMASLHPLCLSTVPPVSRPARGRVSGCYGRLWLLYTHYVYPQYHLSPVLLGVVFLAATGVYGFSAPIMFIHSTTCRPSCSGSCFWLLPASMASLHPLCLLAVPPVARPARGRVSGCYRRLWLLCTHYVYPQYHLSPVLLGVVFLAATGVYGFSAPIMFIHSTTCRPSCSGSCFWLLPASMASLHPLCLLAVPPVSCPARGRVSGCYGRLWLLCTHYVY